MSRAFGTFERVAVKPITKESGGILKLVLSSGEEYNIYAERSPDGIGHLIVQATEGTLIIEPIVANTIGLVTRDHRA